MFGFDLCFKTSDCREDKKMLLKLLEYVLSLLYVNKEFLIPWLDTKVKNVLMMSSNE